VPPELLGGNIRIQCDDARVLMNCDPLTKFLGHRRST